MADRRRNLRQKTRWRLRVNEEETFDKKQDGGLGLQPEYRVRG